MYNPAPQSFFGPGFSLASSEIRLKTADATATTTGGTFTASADTDIITTATAHNLKVGDIVSFTEVGTLPAGLAAATDYFVRTVPSTLTFTLSATKAGDTLDLTTAGAGSNTVQAKGPLIEVTDVEAHASTGDWRKVLYGIMEMIYQKSLNTPIADRPSRMQVFRSSSTNETTGHTTRNYTFQFVTEAAGVEVVPEP